MRLSTIRAIAIGLLLFTVSASMGTSEIEPAPQMATHTPHSKYFEANVFFVRWNTSTSVALSIEAVRSQADVSISYRESGLANSLADFLQGEVHRLPPGDSSRDIRLVVDFVDRAGVKTTFYATRFGFYSEDGQIQRAIDDSFRRKFEAVAIPSELFQVSSK